VIDINLNQIIYLDKQIQKKSFLRYSDFLEQNRKIFPLPSHFDPFQIYGKALRFLKLESFRQPTVKI